MVDVSQSIASVKVVKVLNSDSAALESVEGLKGRAERMVSKEDFSCARSCSNGPGKEQTQRDSSDSDEWSVSDESEEEERSSILSGKTIKAFQMIERGEPKKKEAIKSQMRLRKDKLEALKRTYIEALERTRVSSSSKLDVKALDEDIRKLKQSFKLLKVPSGRQSALELFRGMY
ncbi:hypothetical protein QQ045_004418 [Rhodiola kirilowii]